MALRLFRHRHGSAAEQVRGVVPGELGARNAAVLQMARKYLVWLLVANAAAGVLSVAALSTLDPDAAAYETFASSLWIAGIGLAVLGVIAALFRIAGQIEASAARLHETLGGGEPQPPVVRKMATVARLIHLGYRLVLFVGVALVIAVLIALRGLVSLL